MKWKRVRIVSMAGVFLMLAVLACGPGSEASMPSIAINSPGSGSKVAVGEEVSIDSTAIGDAGVARVELSVNGVLVGRNMPPSGNPTTFRVVQWWTPTEEGLVTVSVVAFDVNGVSSDSATIVLQVVDSSGVVPTDGPGTVVPPEPTDTPLPPATTETGCTADAQYVADVTIPDGTVMSPGQAFVKTWRVKNSGTCEWGTGYTLVFASGAQMGGPASVDLPAVSAGGEADVSVNQTAPTTYGTHKGTWRMRADDGTSFGPNLSVLITVPAPVTNTPEPPPATDTPEPPPATDTPEPTVTDTPEPTTDTEEVTLSPSSVGSVVEQIGVGSGCYVGDTALNVGQQCFVTFDVSAIPDSATVERAELQFSSVTKTGDPFGDLGDLYVYHHNYGDLDIGDWKVMGNNGDAIDTLHKKSDFDHPRVLNPRGETGLQDSLASDRFQIRFQFVFSDGDGDSKVDTVNIPVIKLKVRYRP